MLWSLDLDVGAASSESSHLYGVSCALASSCVAVGAIVGSASTVLLEGNWDGRAWSAAPRSSFCDRRRGGDLRFGGVGARRSEPSGGVAIPWKTGPG